MFTDAVSSPRLAASFCVAIGAVSAFSAAYDGWKVSTIVAEQLAGPAQGTDFLNLYAGARLLLTDPATTYDLGVQQSLQRSLTGWASPLVPFYLPPYAALLISWQGWLAYPVAYIAWLVLGICCVTLAAYLLAPRWTRWYPLVWLGLSMLFLPCLLGLAQGQTSALTLLCMTLLAAGVLEHKQASTRLALGVIGLAIKPQFAPLFVMALIVARRWRALALTSIGISVLAAVALVRLGADGRTAYTLVSSQKLQETLSADPTFLLGPTLLHAGHWFFGVNDVVNVAALLLDLVVLACVALIWRHGPQRDDALLLQLAVLPVASVIVAPYALVYELTGWLVTFWLLWRYTECRSAARAGLLWLTSAVWLAGDVGVATPLVGGADAAALLGVAIIVFVGTLYRQHGVPTYFEGKPR